MQRNIFALIVGTSLLGAAALAACSSGGGNSTSPAINGNALSPGGSQLSSSNGTTFTFTINRTAATKGHRTGQSAGRTVKGTRKPDYISNAAEGLQVAVTATGATSVTKYIDISLPSPLCSTSGPSETCTLTIPTIAATEKITITEVDQLPTNDGTNGNPAGYGSGFPSNSNILAVGSTTSTTTGAVSLTLGLNPVLAEVFDSEDCGDNNFATLTPGATANAGFDEEGFNQDRIVVTAGVAQTIIDYSCFFDSDDTENFAGGTPLPMADVNGSPTPVTWTSNSQHALVAIYNTSSPPPTPTSQTASMADTSMLFAGNCIGYVLKLDGNLTQPATLTLSNNLTATNPFTNVTENSTEVVTIVPLSIVATPGPISQTGPTTTTVTASDYGDYQGLIPYASINSSGVGSNAFACLDSGSVDRATISNPSAITAPNWQQTFTITPQASPVLTVPVTCTFVLGDANTATMGHQGYVASPVVTVTINP